MADLSASAIVRRFLAGATIVFLGAGLVDRSDPRWLMASAAFGAMWLSWDLLVDHVLGPLGEWVAARFTERADGEPLTALRPTLDDTVRLLEAHLRRGASRQVDINAALRLSEIYRTVKRDPENASRVIAIARARYPDAPELDALE